MEHLLAVSVKDRHIHTTVCRTVWKFRLERMLEVSCSRFCSNHGLQKSQIWLLRVLSILVLKIPKDKDHTTSLGNLLPCITVFAAEKILLVSALNISCSNTCLLSLILCHIPLWGGLLYFLDDILVSTGRLLPNTSFHPDWATPLPKSPFIGPGLQPQSLGWPLLHTLQFINIFPVLGVPKTRHNFTDTV